MHILLGCPEQRPGFEGGQGSRVGCLIYHGDVLVCGVELLGGLDLEESLDGAFGLLDGLLDAVVPFVGSGDVPLLEGGLLGSL